MRNRKVAVVGGGVAGLLTSYLLSKDGMFVTLYESFPKLRPAGAGLTLWPNATTILMRLHLLDGLLTFGKVSACSEIRSQKGKILAKLTLDEYDSPAIGISRFDLLQFLTSKLGEENIKYNHRCVGYEQNQHGVVVHFANGSSEEADLLIGADGIHSNIRNRMNSQPLRYSGYTSWRGIVTFTHDALANGSMFEAWGKGARFGCVPLSDDRVYWFATKNAARNTEWNNKEFVSSLFSDFFQPITALIDQTPDSQLIQTDIFDRKPSLPCVDRRVVLMGDAAHPTTPNLGQGACMAIEDSFFLARLLRENKDIHSALLQYQKMRWKRTSTIVKQSWNWGKFSQAEGPVSVFLRDMTTLMTPSSLQKRMRDTVFRVKI